MCSLVQTNKCTKNDMSLRRTDIMHVDLNYNSSSDVKYFTLATGKILQCDLQNEEMHNTPTCAENKK